MLFYFFFSSRRRHTRWPRDWSSDVCSSDLVAPAGIDQVRAGATVGDIGHAVMNQAHRLGYTINDRFGGHGVGRTMHEAPFVPNHGTPGSGPELVAGQLITVRSEERRVGGG